MKKIRLIFVVLVSVIFLSGTGRSFIIDKKEINSIGIIIPDSANSIVLFAAQELQKHLKLIFNREIAIANQSHTIDFKKQLFVGIPPDGYQNKLEPEESIYLTKENSIYLFGDDLINHSYSVENPGEIKEKILNEALNLNYNRTGTLFAVYNFLENEMGIRWLKPGDDGIFYACSTFTLLNPKESVWIPKLIQRNIRTNLFEKKEQELYGKYAPQEFQQTEEELVAKEVNLLTWMRRMRMGRSKNYRFGHAYTEFWKKYSESNPEIFALNGKGERKPLGRIERVKMCPTSAELPKIIVKEWKLNMQENLILNSNSISACENDGDGFGSDEWCHCDQCMAIDLRNSGEDLTKYATDRYVQLWNHVLKVARAIKKDIEVSCYAYSNVLQPPRKEILEDGILVEFVPMMGGNFKKIKSLYEGWEKRGMKKMMYRPNDLWWELGIPMGQEERLFENYKLAIGHNAIGTDFDAILGYWEGISDMTYYILAKGHVNPKAGFEQLETEYLSSFGDAKDDIAQYYRHWRTIFNTKILNEEQALNDGINPYFLEYHRLYRLTERINDFYTIADFDITDTYLKRALKKDTSEPARNYIRRMLIANQQSRLTFNCFKAGLEGERNQVIKEANDLVNFRILNKDKIDINWNLLFQTQYYQMNDQIGTKYLRFLPKDIKSADAE